MKGNEMLFEIIYILWFVGVVLVLYRRRRQIHRRRQNSPKTFR